MDENKNDFTQLDPEKSEENISAEAQPAWHEHMLTFLDDAFDMIDKTDIELNARPVAALVVALHADGTLSISSNGESTKADTQLALALVLRDVQQTLADGAVKAKSAELANFYGKLALVKT